MSELDYRHSEGEATLSLDNGATLHATKITRLRDNGLSANVVIESPEGPLGGGHLILGDAGRRGSLAQTLANANGFSIDQWAATLTAFWYAIEDAIAMVEGELTPEDLGIIDVSLEDEPGPREEIVQGIVPKNKITSLYADGGTGKSFICILLALCIVLGRRFLDLQTINGDVLYLDFEDDGEEFTRRAYEVARGLKLDAPPPGLFYRRVNRPLAQVFYEVFNHVTKEQISMVVVDSFGAACAGEAEGSRDSIALMQLLQRLPCTVLLIDHEPKARDGRGATQFGSVYKRNLSRSQLRLEDRGWPDAGRHALLLKHTKLNSGMMIPSGLPLYMSFEDGKVSVVRADPNDPSFVDDIGVEGMILAALKELGQATVEEIAKHIGRKDTIIRNAATKMTRLKTIRTNGKKGKAFIYEVAEGGGD